MGGKIIVSNNSALSRKYAAGLSAIQSAIAAWTAKDSARGLPSVYIAIDDAAALAQWQVTPVSRGSDQPEAKRVIDALWTKLNPDYMVILGGPDVIPHQDLKNPVASDPDGAVPSDLPYASASAYSDEIGAFVGATRVVSRLADIVNDSRHANIVQLIDVSANAQPTSVASYLPYLGASAAVWRKSTQLSLTTVFGNAATQQDVPPTGSPWASAMMAAKSHFFNCHGVPADPKWYGQVGNSYPTAQDSSAVMGRVTLGTVLAAECCYGAQLYDPADAGGQMPICNAYLQSGAYAVWGSSTIAYGPAATNDDADLMCQYFFDELLKGASVGRAALVARQRYARKSATLSPVDLKTLAQFMLFGDASNQCIKSEDSLERSMKGVFSPAEAATKARTERRQRLLLDGTEIERTRAISFEKIGGQLPASIMQLVPKFGLKNPRTVSLRVLRRAQAAAAIAGAGKFAPGATQITTFHILQEEASGRESFKLVEVAAADSSIRDYLLDTRYSALIASSPWKLSAFPS